MKKAIVFLFLVLFLTACSGDKPNPNERFEAFITNWNEQEYTAMYDMFSKEALASFSEEDSIERQQKIYEDLSIENVNIEYEPLGEESLETVMEDGTATYPFTVKMDSLAGEISFDYKATLVREGEEEKNWFINWDSGFIFPELKDGGSVHVEILEPERGEILDRDQMPLALNAPVYEVGIIPGKLGDNQENAISQIAELLGMQNESIKSKLEADWVKPDHFVPLAKISQSKESTKNELLTIPGVMINTKQGRVYPAGKAAGHLVGYLRQVNAEDLEKDEEGVYEAGDMIGARGLEQLYEDELRGEEGARISIRREDDESIVLAEKPTQNGKNIITTIDSKVQQKVFEAYEDEAGTAAAMDPKTGETLALVSSPAFDPNEIMYGTTPNLWSTYKNNERMPLINRFASTFAPGSVIKPITAAIGLKNGTIDPNEGVEIQGLTWSNGAGWGNYKVTRVSTSNGPVDLEDALVRSDNIYFAMQAVDMGADALTDGLKQFGFGEDFPFTYPVSASHISRSGTIDDEVLLANTSYGQGELEVSPIHMATMYTAILNNGDMLKPILLNDEETGQIWKENLISIENTEILQQALRAVVTDGTAKKAMEADIPISAKTGTAELKLTDDEAGDENSWLVAYPTEDQDILLAMMMEKTQDKSSSYLVEKATQLINELK